MLPVPFVNMFLFLLSIYIPWNGIAGSTGHSVIIERLPDIYPKNLCPISGLLAMCEALNSISVTIDFLVYSIQEL